MLEVVSVMEGWGGEKMARLLSSFPWLELALGQPCTLSPSSCVHLTLRCVAHPHLFSLAYPDPTNSPKACFPHLNPSGHVSHSYNPTYTAY